MSLRSVLFNGAGSGPGETNLVALMVDEAVVAECKLEGRGASDAFAPLFRGLWREAGWTSAPDLVAAVVGPGSFTGLRASLSLAAGLAAGWGCDIAGVTLGEAIRATLGAKPVTCISLARRGRIFVDTPGKAVMAMQTDAPDLAALSSDWSFLAGDAVQDLVVSQGERWHEFQGEILPCDAPSAAGILLAARQRLEKGSIRQLKPLYVDPPEAKPPAAGLRPAPL